MIEVVEDNDVYSVKLTKSEALILFEWLTRNSERTYWDDEEYFNDPAEKLILLRIEGGLCSLLVEPFQSDYDEIISRSYREIVPNPEDWT